jgi:hypothetical protein
VTGALELGEDLAEAVVVDAERIAQLSPGQRVVGAANGAEDAVVQRWICGSGRPIVAGEVWGVDDLQVSCGAVGARGEPKLDGLDGGCGAMLEGESEVLAAEAGASEIRSVIVPCVEITRASQGLAEVGADGLAHVVHDDDGDIEAALQLAEVAEQGGDVSGAVFVEAVQSHERVEQQELRAQVLEGGGEASLIGRLVESDGRGGDDVQIERVEVEGAVKAEACDASADLGESVLGEVDESGTGVESREATEERRSGRETDGEVEP